MADAGCDGAGQGSFFRKNSITLGIKPHIVRYLQLTHTASAIRQLRCCDCGRIASDKHLHAQLNLTSIGSATQRKPKLQLGGRYFEDKCCVAWRRTRVLVVKHVSMSILCPVRWQRGAVRLKGHSSSAREAGVEHDSVRCKHKCGGGRRKIWAKFCTPSGGGTGVGLGRGWIRRHLQ